MWKISNTVFENTKGSENFIQGELKDQIKVREGIQ
jgi:hypothetical protein